MRTKIIIAAGAVLALSAPLVAAGAGKGWWQQSQTRAEAETKIKAHFATMDANKDGAVTAEEAKSVRGEKMEERRTAHFDTMDTNKDGNLSRDEFTAGHAAMRGQMGDGGKHDGMGRGHHGGGHKGMGRHGGGRGMGGDRLMMSDANKDGKVTLAEMTSNALARFDAADANKDKTVTPEERKAHRQAMRAAKAQ